MRRVVPIGSSYKLEIFSNEKDNYGLAKLLRRIADELDREDLGLSNEIEPRWVWEDMEMIVTKW